MFSTPLFPPHLECQEEPERRSRSSIAVVESLGDILRQSPVHDSRTTNAVIGKVVLNQFLEILSQPIIDGYREPFLWPVNKMLRDISVKNALENMLWSERTTPKMQGQPEGKLGQAVVKQRLSSFDTCSHGCTIDLGEDVLGKVMMEVPEADLVRGCSG